MQDMRKTLVAVIIPNWNGKEFLNTCLHSIEAQTMTSLIIVVDNGSTDGSQELIRSSFPNIHLIPLDKNYGFVGGVNPGISYAISQNIPFVALFNNDAMADTAWLSKLYDEITSNDTIGIVASKIRHFEGSLLDSTGEEYSVWGLPFARGRDEIDTGQYDTQQEIFSASGGASMYRSEMLSKIGLFDQRFFAYFEDVDISFRAQLSGWRVRYQPTAVVYHRIGGTSGRHPGLSRFHSVKNYHYIFIKNMPLSLMIRFAPRYIVMILLMIGSDFRRGLLKENFRANAVAFKELPSLLKDRHSIQRRATVSSAYILSLLYKQLPPTQRSIFKLRRRLIGR